MDAPSASEIQDALEKYVRFLKRTRDMGVAGHRGGLAATRRLLELCELQPGQLVLDVGCGSGYTAATMAKESGVRVVAGDRESHLLLRTAERTRSMKVAESVSPVRLDVERLPFADSSFDGVLCESVLASMADRSRAAAELGRVIRPGGFLANNEITFLKPPPDDFLTALREASARSGGVLVVPVDQAGHARLLDGAGFAPLTVETGDASTRQHTLDQMQIDGLRALKPMFASMFNRELRGAVYRRVLAEVIRTLDECAGYGLYFGRKSG